jgi:hypothetical protein
MTPNSPDDDDDKPMVMIYMDPILKIAEVLGRALLICEREGVFSPKQLIEFQKAMNRAKTELDNDLLDLQMKYQAEADAGELEDGDVIPIELDKLEAPEGLETIEFPKPTHYTTKKVN